MDTDRLLNFGLKNISSFGILGNPMMQVSFLMVILALLIQYKKIYRYASLFLIAVVVIFAIPKLHYFTYARGDVWLKTFLLTLKHPFFGYGMGTFKGLFPVLATGRYTLEGTHWMQAHNCWVQIPFEIGYLGLGILLAMIGIILFKNRKVALILCGAAIIAGDMLIHFPTRMCQSLILIILFLAFCTKERIHA